MKKFVAIFWWKNPQPGNGGHYTDRIIEARNMKSAGKMAEKIETGCDYGEMYLKDIYEVKGEQA